ncbi:DUF262 domain-containing protein [Pseudomonas protegens]
MSEQNDDMQNSAVEDNKNDAPYEKVKERKVLIQPYDYAVRTLMEMIIEGDLKLDPDYQRNYRWSDDKASRFIESIALNIPVPVLYFAEEADGNFSVIDGQQRLASLFRYIKPDEAELLYPDSILPPLELNGLKLRPDLNKKSYISLERDDRSLIAKRPIRCIVVLNESDATLKFEVFERLNTGSSELTAQEVRNCIYNGSLSRTLKKLSANVKFQEMISLPDASKRNMTDIELILRFFAYRNMTPETQYSDNYTEHLNNFMEENREISSEKIDFYTNLFNKTVETIYQHLGPGVAFRKPLKINDPTNSRFAGNLINGSIFESQMISVSKLLENGYPIPDDLRNRILSAFTKETYTDSVFQGTSQKSKVLRRNSTLTEIVLA